ncbi:hypothetical protein PCANC_12489 [Puccinia coronata f. sp. avenae]|uniref:Uncharacterized protein n=1 Tax=Puccinia coronata f. sp. avenae TaxID=200324 RepID=A0A2N5UL66_9BASI|nr:hypothetical protein PCASD_23290 [Puccinia coronata f. sp. avenae]PLW38495.1 hypothetical protein PCANC_12489 [Puccinia coronata f. sp. avenae]
MLLGLLQDGKQDTATINCSFSQVYTRASKTLTTVTPKSTSKLRRTTHVGPLTHFPGEVVPNLIALRCLEALPLLMSSNDRVPIYFLTKQEVHVALHRCSAKNGKESITSLVVLIGKPLTALAKKSEETKNQHASASTSAVPTGTLNEAGEALATSKKENSYNGSIYPTRPIYSISLALTRRSKAECRGNLNGRMPPSLTLCRREIGS